MPYYIDEGMRDRPNCIRSTALPKSITTKKAPGITTIKKQKKRGASSVLVYSN